MIFDGLGLPRDNGATDYKDSARLAGLLTVMGWPQNVYLIRYVNDDGNFIRHPSDSDPSDFSRDQMIPLVAGLKTKGLLGVVRPHSGKEVAQNGDPLSPSQRNHIRMCAGLNPSWIGLQWLKLDILYSAYVDPMAEPNQLICMLMIAGPEYVRMWTSKNNRWRDAINAYWRDSFRKEPELAEFLIKKLEAI